MRYGSKHQRKAPQDTQTDKDSQMESNSSPMADWLALASYEDMKENRRKDSSSPPAGSTPSPSRLKPFHQLWSEL